MDLTHWIMTISAILIFKFNRDEIGTSWPPFLFIFISLDSARICRYFQFNHLVPRCSIGINCHFVPPQRSIYSKSQDKKNFHYLSLITGSRFIYIYIIFLSFRFIAIRSRLDVPKISISLHPRFLFRQSYEEWMREKYSHFQSPILFYWILYWVLKWSKKWETLSFLTEKKK